MSIHLVIQGISITCDSASDAAHLIRELANRPRTEKPQEPAGNGHIPRRDRVQDTRTRTALLLEIVHKAAHGITSDQLAQALGLSATRGIGGVMMGARGVLESLGFRTPNVIIKTGVGKGRTWKPGRDIEAAIAKISLQEGG